jgi:AbiU2
MNDQALSKIRGHTEHLLDLHIGLRNKYTLLSPLLPGGFVFEEKRTGPATLGLDVLRVSLFLSCVQDLVKATVDKDKRAPSLLNIMFMLADPSICDILRRTYAESGSKSADEDMRVDFDSTNAQLQDDWQHLQHTTQLNSCQLIRNKLIAHTEVRLADSSYSLLDISSLGLKWTDVGALMLQLEDIVVALNKIVRCSSFDFDDLNAKLNRAQVEFWSRA